MNKFDRKSLKELGELEQDMATGLTDNGEQVSIHMIETARSVQCGAYSAERKRARAIYCYARSALVVPQC
jgi:hypothetical protein